MAYECKILADSISDEGHRLTTFEVTFPRFILAEVNTHRMLSRNSASSRAIPVAKSIAAVEKDPFVPEEFGKNQPGMQFAETLDDEWVKKEWFDAIGDALVAARRFDKLGVHKAQANRVLEPYKWHTAIITATDWSNFFALRTHKDAQPEFHKIALMMQEAYQSNEPWYCPEGCWHIPLVSLHELGEYPDPDYNWWTKVSVGRCARVSYMTHAGQRDPVADVGLHNRLRESGHLSPFEHVARPFSQQEWAQIRSLQQYRTGWQNDPFLNKMRARLEYAGNLRGWYSCRIDIPHEEDYGAIHH